MIDKAVSNLIRESNLHLILNHMQTQKIKGNQLLNDHLVQLVEQKIISPDQAYYKAVEKESLLKTLQQRGLAGNISEAS
jgi:twitching motility protein PilT